MSLASGPASSHGEFVQAENVRVDAENQGGRNEEAADRPARLHTGRQWRRVLYVLLLLPVRLPELPGGQQRAGLPGPERVRGNFQRRQPLCDTEEALVPGEKRQLFVLQPRGGGRWGGGRWEGRRQEPDEEDGAAQKAEQVAAAGRVGLGPGGGEAERGGGEGQEEAEAQQAAGPVPEDEGPGPEPEEEPAEAGTHLEPFHTHVTDKYAHFVRWLRWVHAKSTPVGLNLWGGSFTQPSVHLSKCLCPKFVPGVCA